jgi:glycosyltransferase involved in cell wall biosynthesis
MLRQHEAFLGIGLSSRLLCAHIGAGRPARQAAECARIHESKPTRIGRKLFGRPDDQAKAEARIGSALRQSAEKNQFEIFSTPYSRFSPETHPWIIEADVVHLHWIAGFVDYSRFFSSLSKAWVWTLHDQAPYQGGFHYEADRETARGLKCLDDEFRSIKKQAMTRPAFKPAVVGNSVWNTERAMASDFFPPGTRFETIYYPLDTAAYTPTDKRAAKLSLGIMPDQFTVGFASTSIDNPRKGFRDLLRAFSILDAAPASRPLGLLSFGRPAEIMTLQETTVPWRQFGYVEDDAIKSTLYSAMDCFVIPSHAEAFGQTAIEAMACETTVIGARVGGIVEALDNGRAGLLFPPTDAEAIASLVLRLLEHPEEARALGEAGRRHVKARHEPRTCAAAYGVLYKDLIGAHSAIPL